MSVHTKVLANVQTFAIGTYAILIDHFLQKEPTNSRKLALQFQHSDWLIVFRARGQPGGGGTHILW